MKLTNDQIAQEIASSLFNTPVGEAERLVLEIMKDGKTIHLGGWCRRAVELVIEERLNAICKTIDEPRRIPPRNASK